MNVLIVDDQAPFLHAMSAVIEEADGFRLVASASSGEDARPEDSAGRYGHRSSRRS